MWELNPTYADVLFIEGGQQVKFKHLFESQHVGALVLDDLDSEFFKRFISKDAAFRIKQFEDFLSEPLKEFSIFEMQRGLANADQIVIIFHDSLLTSSWYQFIYCHRPDFMLIVANNVEECIPHARLDCSRPFQKDTSLCSFMIQATMESGDLSVQNASRIVLEQVVSLKALQNACTKPPEQVSEAFLQQLLKLETVRNFLNCSRYLYYTHDMVLRDVTEQQCCTVVLDPHPLPRNNNSIAEWGSYNELESMIRYVLAKNPQRAIFHQSECHGFTYKIIANLVCYCELVERGLVKPGIFTSDWVPNFQTMLGPRYDRRVGSGYGYREYAHFATTDIVPEGVCERDLEGRPRRFCGDRVLMACFLNYTFSLFSYTQLITKLPDLVEAMNYELLQSFVVSTKALLTPFANARTIYLEQRFALVGYKMQSFFADNTSKIDQRLAKYKLALCDSQPFRHIDCFSVVNLASNLFRELTTSTYDRRRIRQIGVMFKLNAFEYGSAFVVPFLVTLEQRNFCQPSTLVNSLQNALDPIRGVQVYTKAVIYSVKQCFNFSLLTSVTLQELSISVSEFAFFMKNARQLTELTLNCVGTSIIIKHFKYLPRVKNAIVVPSLRSISMIGVQSEFLYGVRFPNLQQVHVEQEQNKSPLYPWIPKRLALLRSNSAFVANATNLQHITEFDLLDTTRAQFVPPQRMVAVKHIACYTRMMIHIKCYAHIASLIVLLRYTFGTSIQLRIPDKLNSIAVIYAVDEQGQSRVIRTERRTQNRRKHHYYRYRRSIV